MPIQGLSYAVRTAYGDTFRLAVASGTAKPLLVPWCLLGPFVVPALWLAVPHKRRMWFYHTRWLVMAFIVWSNVYHLRYASSTNMACAYAAGLAATWGTILSLNLLIWTRPQFDAARVLRVKKDHNLVKAASENAKTSKNGNENGNGNELRTRKRLPKRSKSQTNQQQEEFEYIWEPYPEGGFLERLAWATDLILSFRCSGWNWSVSSIPRPTIPLQISHGDKVDMHSIPTVSRSGYKLYRTEAEFVRDRLIKVIVLYFVLDFLSVYMVKDPYFILGPDHKNYGLPPHLQSISPWLLLAYREIFCLVGVYAAIEAVFGVSDLVQYWMANRFYPSRGSLFQFASTFGSFEQVLDRGLAGWWGSLWHQTFRMQFAAPATYLFREGYLKRGTRLASLLAILISFSQSGILHASGSITSVPRTKPWRAPAFFFLQVVGIMLQQSAAWFCKAYMPRPPQFVSRTVNLLFTMAWFYFTAPLFIDDLSSTGLWVVEPVPISLFRFLGFGHEGDHWWRWDWDHLPKFYIGETWWETGIAL
ncbi:uncharacterized protein TRIVIDRAFT_160870 [Trichoderma virens Gv29-8]|uniref:Wax synthase domain-containing protein n=1 Tax=Hypocrea virens (strain Gv29-8 / FGSC 10586) TaxID=413071 RepID=G9N744_HYPVG|nr:uncharacterized protein TRIVIDRAFT_160870 [Trichoderma virens Gv29-8]EHK17542.1 hypothetical protein TRIVIDRAFT_160870 [Trichoderma virens Gv29-8]